MVVSFLRQTVSASWMLEVILCSLWDSLPTFAPSSVCLAHTIQWRSLVRYCISQVTKCEFEKNSLLATFVMLFMSTITAVYCEDKVVVHPMHMCYQVHSQGLHFWLSFMLSSRFFMLGVSLRTELHEQPRPWATLQLCCCTKLFSAYFFIAGTWFVIW